MRWMACSLVIQATPPCSRNDSRVVILRPEGSQIAEYALDASMNLGTEVTLRGLAYACARFLPFSGLWAAVMGGSHPDGTGPIGTPCRVVTLHMSSFFGLIRAA